MRKGTSAIIMTAMCAVLLAGCGNKKVEYGDKTAAENVQSDEQQRETSNDNGDLKQEEKPLGKLATSLGATGTWETDIVWKKDTGGTGSVKVNVEVSVPDVEGMSVVKLSQKSFDESEREKIARYLFDEGSICAIGNGGYESKEDIMEILRKTQEEYDGVQSDSDGDGFISDSMLEELSARTKMLQDLYDNFETVDGEDFSQPKFRGTVGGKTGILEFESVGKGLCYEDGNMVYKEYSTPAISFHMDADEAYRENDKCVISGLSAEAGDFGENRASISMEQAEGTVNRFLEEAGIDGMEIAERYDLNWAEVKESGEYEPIESNGYLFFLYRSVNGCPASLGLMRQGDFDEGGIVTHGEEYMRVCVTDAGIIDITYSLPCQVEEVMAEQAELLSFDRIQSVVEERAPEYLSHYFTGEVTLDKMSLNYVLSQESVVLESGERFRYLIPAWFIYKDQVRSAEWIELPSPSNDKLIINAIDGTLID